MGSVVFVHGTGVRQPAFYETFEIIKMRLARVAPTAVPVPCYWGEAHGATLRCDGRSIPRYDETKAVGVAPIGSDELALWALLYEDPLAELRALAAKGGPAERLPPGKRSFASRVPADLVNLTSSRAVAVEAARCRVGRFVADAAAAVASEAVLLGEAVQATNDLARLGAGGYDLAREVIARAVVASMLARATAAGMPAVDAAARDALVLQVFVALEGTAAEAKGLWGDALRRAVSPVVSGAARVATWRLRTRRGAVTDALSPASGDILVYQTRGAPIRAIIRQTIEAATPPVFLLAHSLGGIACVDLCVLDPPLAVAGLVTAGSQAPYLYEIGALASLEPGAALPPAFPPWINLHDPNDLLAYIGAGVFPGRVDDVEVRSGLPFPHSHSAYWTSDVLWQKIAALVA
jgi:hypothetical protein